jgi:hypothetical protein
MSSKSSDWMPVSLEKKYELIVRAMIPYFNTKRAAFGMGQDTPLGKWYDDEFTPQGYIPFTEAYADWVDLARRTPVAIARIRSVEKTSDPLFRQLYRALRNNPRVTNADLEAMGLPLHLPRHYRPAPVADTVPQFGIVPLTGCRIQINYYPQGTSRKRGKPKGQHGAEIRWAFSEEPVNDAEQLTNSVFSTASPAILAFTGHDSGRVLYVALRWENTRGEKGPWSNIASIFVP